MKMLSILFILISGTTSWAAEAPKAEKIETKKADKEFMETPIDNTNNNWRFGIGFGIQPQMQNATNIEVGTGELFQCRRHGLSLILSYLGSETEAKDTNNEHYQNDSFRLMVESKGHGTNPYSNVYVRLGVGYTSTDKVFHPDGGFIMMPFEIGIDTEVMKTDWSRLAFFAQAGSEINFLGKNTAARDFDGLGITLGLRGYY